MSREYQIPGGEFVQETGTREYLTPGGSFVQETVTTTTFNAAFNIAANAVIQPGALQA